MLKKAEIQLRSTRGSLEQQERLLEPLQVKLEEIKGVSETRQVSLADLHAEVEMLRKTVAQQVR